MVRERERLQEILRLREMLRERLRLQLADFPPHHIFSSNWGLPPCTLPRSLLGPNRGTSAVPSSRPQETRKGRREPYAGCP